LLFRAGVSTICDFQTGPRRNLSVSIGCVQAEMKMLARVPDID
jgi:hypothetical protein